MQLLLFALAFLLLFKPQIITEMVWDQISEYRIGKLHPLIRDKVRSFLKAAEAHGIFLRVTDGLRTFKEQGAIYNQPFDKIDNDLDGVIDEADEKVSNAKPGSSYHNYGLAFDVVPMVGLKPVWNSDKWSEIARIGKSYGFFWGGDFKSFIDKPHFEFRILAVSSLLALYNNKEIDKDGYVKIAA